MKKEYLILIILIAGLSLYIFYRQDNQINYTLPEVNPIKAKEIDKITINWKSKSNSPIELKKINSSWKVGIQNFPADKTYVTNMLDQLEKFSLLALVSEKDDLARYELDAETGILVSAWKTDQEIRSFTIGKTAPSFNHTFVMLGNTTPIYQAKGNLRAVFEKKLSELRSKQVINFIPSSINSIALETKGQTKTFTAAKDNNDKDKELLWKDSSNKILNNTKPINELISTLSDLRCESFTEKSKKDTKKDYTHTLSISMNGEAKKIVLQIITDKTPFKAFSSMNDYEFVLSDYTTEQIKNQVDILMGIENGIPKS